ncbi:MAG: stage III sporulation protein AB [Clostridia bacterium]|nr:stage III sporulation protein AB [Clostridia bacterium]
MTIKIICAAVIVISCSYVGVKMSNLMRMRVRVLTDMLAAVGHIESFISTVRMPLSEIYRTLAESKGNVGEFFSGLTAGESWAKRLEKLTGLSPQDKEMLAEFSVKLGSYDSERQLDEIRLSKSRLEANLLQAKTDLNENSRIYRSMSFFAGVVIAILLI